MHFRTTSQNNVYSTSLEHPRQGENRFSHFLTYFTINRLTSNFNPLMIFNRYTAILFFSILFALPQASAQREGNIWYFGKNMGLDFNGDKPVLLKNGAMNTHEGCASISDAGGNLLFYSDGRTVWNSRHEIMKNGEGLMGHYSATQSAVIIPKPRSRSTYYIFTIDAAENKLEQGLRYTEINMIGDGGLGEVKYKNKPLVAPTCEKITAVVDQNGRDFWVLTHGWGNNLFYAFKVTDKGVEEVSITSEAGLKIKGANPQNGAGYMKASPNGEYLAVTLYMDNRVELFKFDNSTGEVKPWFKLPRKTESAYGIEFSPDSEKLFVGSFATGSIDQYNLSFAKTKDIIGSRHELSPPNDFNLGALQLGPDGRIYTTSLHYSYIGVIQNPNAYGTRCRYRKRYIKIGKNQGRLGLPTFIQTYFSSGEVDRRKALRAEEKAKAAAANQADSPEPAPEPELPKPPKRPQPQQVVILVKEKIFEQIDDPNSPLRGLQLLEEAQLAMTTPTKVLDYSLDNGSIRLQLNPEHTYRFQAGKSGYLNNSATFQPAPELKSDTVEIVLDKIYPEKEIVLDNIYYDFDKANLRLEALPELDKLLSIMNENEDIRVQIASHTDCQGEDRYNEKLSQDRAQSVVDYLVDQGIEADRLVARGFGESQPAADCACTACSDDEHQKNRRTTFKILR